MSSSKGTSRHSATPNASCAQCSTPPHTGYKCLSAVTVMCYWHGTVHAGRPEEEMGAHALHFNEHSIGICMVGGVGAAGADPHNPGKYTAAQWIALRRLIDDIESRHPIKRICGHRDLSPDVNSDGHIEPSEWIKLCPSFDVDGWREAGMFPAALNVLEDPCSKT